MTARTVLQSILVRASIRNRLGRIQLNDGFGRRTVISPNPNTIRNRVAGIGTAWLVISATVTTVLCSSAVFSIAIRTEWSVWVTVSELGSKSIGAAMISEIIPFGLPTQSNEPISMNRQPPMPMSVSNLRGVKVIELASISTSAPVKNAGRPKSITAPKKNSVSSKPPSRTMAERGRGHRPRLSKGHQYQRLQRRRLRKSMLPGHRSEKRPHGLKAG